MVNVIVKVILIFKVIVESNILRHSQNHGQSNSHSHTHNQSLSQRQIYNQWHRSFPYLRPILPSSVIFILIIAVETFCQLEVKAVVSFN